MAVKQPPYANLLAERAAAPANQQQCWWVLVGDGGWDKAAIWAEYPHRVFTLCPPGEDPAGRDWSRYRKAPPPVGLVRCGSVDGDQLYQLVQALLSAGSPRVFDLLADAVYAPAGAAS